MQTKDEDGGAGPQERLVVLRSVEAKPRTTYALSNARHESRAVYARVHGQRHRIEELLEEGKEEVGLDESEVRSWVGWHQYGWEFAPSGMHTVNSAIDGKKIRGDTLCRATLKSGPRCLNDEMSENFADAILNNCVAWAKDAGKKKLDFTYGVLYGMRKQSNKKDWHILRNITKKLPKGIKENREWAWLLLPRKLTTQRSSLYPKSYCFVAAAFAASGFGSAIRLHASMRMGSDMLLSPDLADGGFSALGRGDLQ